ncbi:MAG: response regulator, partial [bacterium]|nr:response regulator [bacterium]
MKSPEWERDIAQSIILIIDDNTNNLGVLIGYLEELGFGIVSATNGELGLKRAKLMKPNLILLDVMMPGWDGFETCRRLKADEETREIPVIFMTALTDPEDTVKASALGAVDYITKPLHQGEVIARVITHLRVRGLTQRLQQANEKLSQAMEALWGEMELAKKIQTSLLPTAIADLHPDFDLAAIMLPA